MISSIISLTFDTSQSKDGLTLEGRAPDDCLDSNFR